MLGSKPGSYILSVRLKSCHQLSTTSLLDQNVHFWVTKSLLSPAHWCILVVSTTEGVKRRGLITWAQEFKTNLGSITSFIWKQFIGKRVIICWFYYHVYQISLSKCLSAQPNYFKQHKVIMLLSGKNTYYDTVLLCLLCRIAQQLEFSSYAYCGREK